MNEEIENDQLAEKSTTKVEEDQAIDIWKDGIAILLKR